MPSPEPFHLFTRKLNELGIPYMVSGSVAAMFYGEPRMTNDVDIIVFLKRDDVARLETAFPREEFYCPPQEVLHLETAREQRGHFNLIHHETGFKADIYTSGRDPLHAWGLAHAKQVKTDIDIVMIAPPEYVIVRKLQFFREGQSQKHLRDVSRMLLESGETWGTDTLNAMIAEHGLLPEWEAMQAFMD